MIPHDNGPGTTTAPGPKPHTIPPRKAEPIMTDTTTDANDSAALDALLDAVDAPPATEWNPEPGDKLAGTIAAVEVIDTKNGAMPVLTITAPDGTDWRVAAGRTALRRQLVRCKVQPGDLIALKYAGLVESANGREYHDYIVRTDTRGVARDDRALVVDPKADDDSLGLVADLTTEPDPWASGGTWATGSTTDDDVPGF